METDKRAVAAHDAGEGPTGTQGRQDGECGAGQDRQVQADRVESLLEGGVLDGGHNGPVGSSRCAPAL